MVEANATSEAALQKKKKKIRSSTEHKTLAEEHATCDKCMLQKTLQMKLHEVTERLNRIAATKSY